MAEGRGFMKIAWWNKREYQLGRLLSSMQKELDGVRKIILDCTEPEKSDSLDKFWLKGW